MHALFAKSRILSSSACAVFLATSLMAVPAAAQSKPEPAKSDAAKAQTVVPSEPASTTATYGNWLLRCVQMPAAPAAGADATKSGRAAAQTCEVVQIVQVQGQQQPIAQIALGRLPDDKDILLTALLPVNIALPGAVHVSGNGKAGAEEKGGFDLAWQRCYAGSCAASAKPDATSLGLWRAGAEGQLRLIDAAGQTVAIPISWKGLDQAMAALEKMK